MRSLTPFAVLEFLFPRRLIAAAERIAFENPDEATLRASTVPIARLEGVAFARAFARDEPVSGPIRALVGVLAVPMLLRPDAVLDVALRLAYRNGDAIRVRGWVRPVTRLLGAFYALVALGLVAGRSRSD